MSGWKKVLYIRQNVPDNYVDDSFLDQMKNNLNSHTYDYWTVVLQSGVVTQQICSVCIFVAVFLYMSNDWLDPRTVFIASSLLSVIGYICYDQMTSSTPRVDNRTRYDDVKSAVMFVVFGFGLSPILMTLTETISTDTIYAMTTFMLLSNICFHDYGATAAVVSGALSFNAAIFASVCLASRFDTTWHTFSTITFAVEIFALWPELRRKIKLKIPHGLLGMTFVMVIVTCTMLVCVSPVGAILLLGTVLFITFICPYWLIKLQPYKNNIHGPWDEAVIKE
ncbi:phosphatidylinositol N-acetylglucosaminyltransferase subunit C-like [Tubulanus polymorphus]|uniref:phosphatidylinositol N-acetylglucosaminyltransferase subunit C-like n=1 Tax=Tubulanus polymorphus TaxID=672921 RepID=UPI003DA4A10D